MNSHDTLNSKKCCLSRNAAVFLVYDRDSGRARWLAIVAAVLTVSASSPRSMEASSRLADASRLSDDGDLTGGRASVQTDAAYSAPLPAPDSYRTGHSMQETNGALDAQARAVFGPEREPNAAAIPPQVAAHALAPSAPGHISTPDEVSAPELPSLGVLSTQEKPAQQAPPPHAASRSVSAASPAWEGGEHASAMELPGTDARTPAPPPALVAQERSPAGQPGASAGEPPMSVRSTNDVRTPEAAPQSSAPASAGATEPHVDVTGQLTPGTVSALADLLSGVSISAAATPPSARRKQDAAVGLVYDEAMERHWGPANHPECPERTAHMFRMLNEEGLAERCWRLPARKATDEELLRGHSAAHIAAVDGGFDTEVDGVPPTDIFVSDGTPAAARLAAGCVVEAVQRVVAGDVRRAFAVVRPPGHHAECERAMGFCLFNNVAIGALAAVATGLSRVLVLDWDVHHGNGIQSILEADPRILYVSIHRGNGFYPGTGHVEEVGVDKGRGYTLNVPWLKGGHGDAEYLLAFDLVLGPVIAAFDPQLVLVSAGFDAVEGDPLGGSRVSPECFAHMTDRLMRFADGKIVLALEGGYNVRLTAESATQCMRVLLGAPPPTLPADAHAAPRKDAAAVLQAVAAAQAPFWPALESIGTKEQFSTHLESTMAAKGSAGRKTRSMRGFIVV